MAVFLTMDILRTSQRKVMEITDGIKVYLSSVATTVYRWNLLAAFSN
jgi:dTDP-glucose pyrophosphorylase